MTVEVSSNGVDYTRGGMEVWYHGEARLMAVRPSTGPEVGGTEVTLVGDGMVRGGVHSRCRFGAGQDREGRVRWESSTAVACTAPGPGALVGNVTVDPSTLSNVFLFFLFGFCNAGASSGFM